MANNRTYFGNLITGEYIYLDKHYHDGLVISDDQARMIQQIINKTFLNKEIGKDYFLGELGGGREGKSPFVFFSENTEDEEYRYYFIRDREKNKTKHLEYENSRDITTPDGVLKEQRRTLRGGIEQATPLTFTKSDLPQNRTLGKQ